MVAWRRASGSRLFATQRVTAAGLEAFACWRGAVAAVNNRRAAVVQRIASQCSRLLAEVMPVMPMSYQQ